jgi:hypothetical protein
VVGWKERAERRVWWRVSVTDEVMFLFFEKWLGWGREQAPLIVVGRAFIDA